MTTLVTHPFPHDTSVPEAFRFGGLMAAAAAGTGGALADSDAVKGGTGTGEIKPTAQMESPPQGMKFVQLVVLPLLVCVVLITFLRRHVLK